MAFLDRIGAARGADVARACHQTRQSMHLTLVRLHEAGLVDRWAGERAGRDVKVGLTRSGEAVFSDAAIEVSRLHGTIVTQLGERERLLLQTLLESTVRALEQCERYPILFVGSQNV